MLNVFKFEDFKNCDKIQMKSAYHVTIKIVEIVQKQIQFVVISGCCIIKIIQWNFYKIKINK